MSLPETLRPVERQETVRRLYAIANQIEEYSRREDVDLMTRFVLSDLHSMARHTARWVQLGFDLSSEERNAA